MKDTSLIKSIAGIREAVAAAKRNGHKIGFVPTMGALHAGHAVLMEQARRQCDFVVASIFVNPTQFNQREDFETYHRDLEADLGLCRQQDVDVVFAPATDEMYPSMYPRPMDAYVDVPRVSEGLCGEFRPGHFRGVATVVMKLFNIVQPDMAFFGQKDAQQLAVVRKMVEDLNCPLVVVAVPTARESDGLAMSSRNQRLTPDERKLAPLLFRTLQAAESAIRSGHTDPGAVKQAALSVLRAEPQFRVEYLEIVDPGEMQPVSQVSGTVCIAVAAWLGSTRLIDNLLISS